MQIVIYDRPISKKNSKNLFYNKYLKRCMLTSSKQWKAFEKSALEQLLNYRGMKYEGLVRVDYVFYFKGNMLVDVDNAMAGINDVLQQAGVILDDKNIRRGSFDVITGNEEWKSVVEITEYEQNR